jgi:hypothetical protein
MSTAALLDLQHYDLARGFEFVGIWSILVFAIVLVLGFRAQYRFLNKYDALDQQRSSGDERARVMLSYVKSTIFAVLGYQGETRERQPVDQLDENWVVDNLGRIFRRFVVFYFIYIWGLIVTTHALYIDPRNGDIHVLTYTPKLLFGFVMIGLYIVSNSVFDILSLFYTVRNLRRIQESPNLSVALLYVGKNLLYSSAFFLLSQILSNIIWPLKINLPIPWIERPFSLAITLWPYAFIVDARSSPPQLLPVIFPGQLLITGTVLLPTIVAVLLFGVIATMARLLEPLKKAMIANDLALVGIVVTPGPSQEPIYQFRCLNILTVGIFSGVISIALWESIRAVLAFV